MGGRGRHAQGGDASPALVQQHGQELVRAAEQARSERELLRLQARELHEAAQRAEAAARELRGARALVEKIAEDKIVAIITPVCAEVVDGINELAKAGNDRIDFQVEHITNIVNIAQDQVAQMSKDVEARLMGYRDSVQVKERLVAEINRSMGVLVKDEAFMGTLAEMVAENLRTSTLRLIPSPGPAAFRVEMNASGG